MPGALALLAGAGLDPAFAAEVQRIADAYPPEAIETPSSARKELFTAAQALAWTLRFRPEELAQDIANRSHAAEHG
jgi:hypothetical protein